MAEPVIIDERAGVPDLPFRSVPVIWPNVLYAGETSDPFYQASWTPGLILAATERMRREPATKEEASHV